MEDKDNCPICLEELKKIKPMACGHYFHDNCIKKWMEIRYCCPVCKKHLKTGEPMKYKGSGRFEDMERPPTAYLYNFHWSYEHFSFEQQEQMRLSREIDAINEQIRISQLLNHRRRLL